MSGTMNKNPPSPDEVKAEFRARLRTVNMRAADLARLIGVAPPSISEYASQRKVPSLQTAYDIALATCGKVPVDFFVREKRPLAERTQPQRTRNNGTKPSGSDPAG